MSEYLIKNGHVFDPVQGIKGVTMINYEVANHFLPNPKAIGVDATR
jgi:hypothetical protein